MRKILPLVLVAVGATALFAWTVLERNGTDGNGSPLSYAPADTPYAMGMDQPFPEALAREWTERADPAMPMYARQLRSAARGLAAQPDAGVAPRLLDAVADEIEGRTTTEVLAAAGLAPTSRMALYGLGLVPVLRWELADPDAFRALVARLEQKSGAPLPTGQLDAQSYWRLAVPQAAVEGIAAVVGNHLVLSFAPAGADPAALSALLGLTRPDPSLTDSDTLEALAERFGYQPGLVGFFDSGRLLTALTGQGTPLEQAFLAALEIERPQLSEACTDEYQQLATLWPRASFGYTRLEADHMEVRAVLETAPELAQDLMTLRAPMPALEAIDEDTAFNLGFSLDLDALPALVNKRANAIASAPYQCPSLAWLNQGATDARGGLNNPALFAMAPVFRGVHAIVEEFALGPDMKPTALRGALVIGSRNPQSLVAMAAMAVPQLAQLKLQPDGSVTPLELPPLPEFGVQVPAWVSMTDTLLGIGFGEGADAALPGYMDSDPDRQPLLVLGYSGRLYAALADIMDNGAAALPDPEARAEMEASAKMMREVYAAWIARAEMRVEFTEHGVEMLQSVTTRD